MTDCLTITKPMQNESETLRCTVKSLDGSAVLVYRLSLSRVPEQIDGYAPCRAECYSITVSKLSGGLCRDERTLPDISRNRDEADRIYSLFTRNSVTPECAFEIIDDILAM